jgi:hypothetical protein
MATRITTSLISEYMVTDSTVHNSQELKTLIDKSDAGQKPLC